MIKQKVCNSYRQEILSGIHTSEHTYKIALYEALAYLNQDTTIYETNFEIVADGYTAGGMILTGFATSLVGNRAYLDFDDAEWDPSTFSARGALIYNSSVGNKAVAVLDFSTDRISVDEPFTVVFASTGLLVIGSPKHLISDGSPEGAVDGEPGTIYWDKLNKSQWVKETGSGNTGWYQEFGPA